MTDVEALHEATTAAPAEVEAGRSRVYVGAFGLVVGGMLSLSMPVVGGAVAVAGWLSLTAGVNRISRSRERVATRALAVLRRLETRSDLLVGLVGSLQWSGRGDVCPLCGRARGTGHGASCGLGRLFGGRHGTEVLF